jgi:hypothetical protein
MPTTKTYDQIRAESKDDQLATLWRLLGALEAHCKPEVYQEKLADARREIAQRREVESAEVIALLTGKKGAK